MVDEFLKKVKDAVTGDEKQRSDVDSNQSQNANTQQFGNVRPASEDPYGDPADQETQGQSSDVRPASEDPYGDPADQQKA
jgi:hypothetical protein